MALSKIGAGAIPKSPPETRPAGDEVAKPLPESLSGWLGKQTQRSRAGSKEPVPPTAKPSTAPASAALAEPAKVASLGAAIQQLKATHEERKNTGTFGSSVVRAMTGGTLEMAEDARDDLVWQAESAFDRFASGKAMTHEQYEHVRKCVDRAYRVLGEVRALRDEGVDHVATVATVAAGAAAAPFTGGASLLATAGISGAVSAAVNVTARGALDGGDYTLERGAIDAAVGFAAAAVPVAAVGGAARAIPLLPGAWKSAVDSLFMPIRPPKTVSSTAVARTAASDLKALDDLGVAASETSDWTLLYGNVNYWGRSRLLPDTSGNLDYGKMLDVVALPAAGRATGANVNAFVHPEMAAYKAKLEAMGCRLVVDTSLRHTGARAYGPTAQHQVLALRPDSPWRVFMHEFQHLEYEQYVLHDFAQYQQAVLGGSRLRAVLPSHVLDELPAKRIDRLEELMRKGFSSNSANETLSIDEELQLLGFRRHIPFMHHGREQYALRHQISDLRAAAAQGGTLSREQQQALDAAYRRYAAILGGDLVASAAAVAGAGAGLYEGAKSVEGSRRAPEDYVQVLYDNRDNLLGQRLDGSWDRLTRKGL